MGRGDILGSALKSMFLGWEFMMLDSVGNYGGLIYSWKDWFHLISSFSIVSGILQN